MDEGTWDMVGRLVAWIDDASVLPPDTERLLRIMKLSEEVGEVAQAVIGVTGQNPRKGVTHTGDDVQAELCDVMLTAMVALATINPDARAAFAAHLDRVAVRSLAGAGLAAENGS
jgi:NTP pyrophosphatase (non-canonical NTP hydrolase)